MRNEMFCPECGEPLVETPNACKDPEAKIYFCHTCKELYYWKPHEVKL